MNVKPVFDKILSWEMTNKCPGVTVHVLWVVHAKTKTTKKERKKKVWEESIMTK